MSLWPHQSAVTDFLPRESLVRSRCCDRDRCPTPKGPRAAVLSPGWLRKGGYPAAHRPSGFILRVCSAFMAAEISLLWGPFWGVTSSGSGHFEGEGCSETAEGGREGGGLEARTI